MLIKSVLFVISKPFPEGVTGACVGTGVFVGVGAFAGVFTPAVGEGEGDCVIISVVADGTADAVCSIVGETAAVDDTVLCAVTAGDAAAGLSLDFLHEANKKTDINTSAMLIRRIFPVLIFMYIVSFR